MAVYLLMGSKFFGPKLVLSGELDLDEPDLFGLGLLLRGQSPDPL